MGRIDRSGSGIGPGVLEARRTSAWRSRYDIVADGRTVTVWEGALWRTGGGFALDGRRYEVRGNAWRSRYALSVADDAQVISDAQTTSDARVATAERTQRKRWTVESDGVMYHFRRPSLWRQEQELLADGGAPAGSVRRSSWWRGDAVADLPGMPLPLRIFVLGVVLTVWDWQASGG